MSKKEDPIHWFLFFSSQAFVYTIDDLTGGLELSHTIQLSAKDFPGSPGYVRELKWTPDGCAVALSWSRGGISLWSTFGTMLMCSLGWDYGLHVDLTNNNPFDITCMDWSTEGYQLFMLRQQKVYEADDAAASAAEKGSPAAPTETKQKRGALTHTYSNLSDRVAAAAAEKPKAFTIKSTLVQLDFVKSSLAVNPCMSSHSHLFLQGDDKLYINQGDSLQKIYHNCKSFSMDSSGSETTNNSAATGKQGNNIFSQSYNICTNKYMKGDFMQIDEGLCIFFMFNYYLIFNCSQIP